MLTLEEIGNNMNITTEGARYILRTAMSKAFKSMQSKHPENDPFEIATMMFIGLGLDKEKSGHKHFFGAFSEGTQRKIRQAALKHAPYFGVK